MTAYGAVESTFVPVGSDRHSSARRGEAGVPARRCTVMPVADISARLWSATPRMFFGRDSDVLAWAYLDAMTPVVAIAIGLSPFLRAG